MTFESLGLSQPLLRALSSVGYASPTAIQKQSIPAVLKGRDVMAAAQTGTGKTAGFTLPMLELLSNKPKPRGKHIHALVLTPTRELAAQVQESIRVYSEYLKLRSTVVFGGVGINPQINTLAKGVDVLVATPGRLLDLHQQRAIRFEDLDILVLDEADRMLDMGFIHDIKKIMGLLPEKRQNLMFSATFSQEIRHLAKGFIDNPVEIDVTPRNSTVDKIVQILHPVDKARKIELLAHLIKQGSWTQVLVFARTKRGADKIARRLAKQNINAAAIHGNKSQSQRTRALESFKKNKIQVLVATDIASRGIDIDQLPHVVNLDLPNVAEDYVHRIGRTGRAGASGKAVSLVSADEIKQLQDIEKLIRFKIKREEIDGFEPDHVVPESVKIKPQPNNRKRNSQSNNSRGPRNASRRNSGRKSRGRRVQGGKK